MTNQPTIMAVNRVTKLFGRNKVLSQVSFEVRAGSSVLIQGPSGCGKTTLLRCMALLEPIDSGYIEFDGVTILTPKKHPEPKASFRLAISMVFQHLHLWPHLTVLENVALPLSLARKLNDAHARRTALEALDFLRISEKANDYPLTLSGGQQQRVALARALVHRPRLLLLDEITANLDRDTSERVLEFVERILNQGTTVVIVSHAPWIPESLRKFVLKYETGEWYLTYFQE